MPRTAWHPGPSEEDAAGGRELPVSRLSVFLCLTSSKLIKPVASAHEVCPLSGHFSPPLFPRGRVEVVLVAAGGH